MKKWMVDFFVRGQNVLYNAYVLIAPFVMPISIDLHISWNIHVVFGEQIAISYQVFGEQMAISYQICKSGSSKKYF